jgi:SARP family transcriptional regulator, regulator of embCAB operon
VYQTARRTLIAELGLEPCRALRELQQAILADDGELELLAVS